MIRNYATPLAFKAALEARLGDRGRATGRSINRERQLFVMECNGYPLGLGISATTSIHVTEVAEVRNGTNRC